jgi:hypothetical protein
MGDLRGGEGDREERGLLAAGVELGERDLLDEGVAEVAIGLGLPSDVARATVPLFDAGEPAIMALIQSYRGWPIPIPTPS